MCLPGLETTVVGGSGDDTIHVGGEHPPLIFDPPAFNYQPPPFEVTLPKLIREIARVVDAVRIQLRNLSRKDMPTVPRNEMLEAAAALRSGTMSTDCCNITYKPGKYSNAAHNAHHAARWLDEAVQYGGSFVLSDLSAATNTFVEQWLDETYFPTHPLIYVLVPLIIVDEVIEAWSGFQERSDY